MSFFVRVSMPHKSVRVNVPDNEDPGFVKQLQRQADYIYINLAERGKIFTDQEENALYLNRLKAYVKDFPGLNKSSDLDDLFAMLTEIIIQHRVLKNSQNTGRSISDSYTESVGRWSKIKTSLAGRRIDRKKFPDRQEDFRQIMEDIFDTNISVLMGQNEILLGEEEIFLKDKEKRDKSLGLNHE